MFNNIDQMLFLNFPVISYLFNGFHQRSFLYVSTSNIALVIVQGLVLLIRPRFKASYNRRISRHKVFKNLAASGKTSVDWFFGFKLHLVVNELGEIVNMSLTPGNIDDRKPVVELLKDLWGKVFADRGYEAMFLKIQNLLNSFNYFSCYLPAQCRL